MITRRITIQFVQEPTNAKGAVMQTVLKQNTAELKKKTTTTED